MDLFNTKKIAELEARIAALEPKRSISDDDILSLASLEERVKKIEEEVMPRKVSRYAIFDIFLDEPEKLTLRSKVEKLCEHLKLQFVTEPQRTVIKPLKKVKA